MRNTVKYYEKEKVSELTVKSLMWVQGRRKETAFLFFKFPLILFDFYLHLLLQQFFEEQMQKKIISRTDGNNHGYVYKKLIKRNTSPCF